MSISSRFVLIVVLACFTLTGMNFSDAWADDSKNIRVIKRILKGEGNAEKMSDGRYQIKQVDSTTSPIVIDQPGSYLLTSDMTYGIEINTNNVSLDFNGFSIVGRGIRTTGSNIENISISNGTIRDGYGISAGSVRNVSVVNVTVIDCDGGIRVGIDSLVQDCRVIGCDESGISVGMYSKAISNVVRNVSYDDEDGDHISEGSGMYLGKGSVASDNIVSNCNTKVGIRAIEGGVIKNNQVRSNSFIGIRCSGNCRISGNDVVDNGFEGIASGFGFIINNTVTGNGGGSYNSDYPKPGLSFGVNTVVKGNFLEGNTWGNTWGSSLPEGNYEF